MCWLYPNADAIYSLREKGDQRRIALGISVGPLRERSKEPPAMVQTKKRLLHPRCLAAEGRAHPAPRGSS
jgi:hypothetical protein